jgi:hypothetical protein
MQDSKEIKRRIAGISRWLLFQLRLLFSSLVSYGRELPEKFRQPPQPALPRLFTVIKNKNRSPALLDGIKLPP